MGKDKMTAKDEGQAALIATYTAFIGAGLLTSTWAARIPQLKVALDMEPAAWGLVLLAMAIGSMSALPFSGLLIRRVGERNVVRFASVVAGLALAGIGLGYLGGVVPVVICLYLLGFSIGIWDVAMNVQGSAVEHRIGRSIMPRFHAGWSVGTVSGALLGALLIQLGVSITVNLVAVGLLAAVTVFIQVRNFLSPGAVDVDEGVDAEEEAVGLDGRDNADGGPHPAVDTFADPDDLVMATQTATSVPSAPVRPPQITLLEAWKEPRTLLIGLSVMVFGFTEGTAIDWIGVALIEDYHTSTAVGTLGLATFLATMTICRWFGTAWLDRFGRVGLLRIQAATGCGGVLLVVFSHSLVLAFIGVALWGFGASLGFPVGMSAAGDDQRNSDVRVSVVATIGYVAGLAGPPLVGLLGQNVGVLWALMLVAVLLPLPFALAGVMRERPSH